MSECDPRGGQLFKDNSEYEKSLNHPNGGGTLHSDVTLYSYGSLYKFGYMR